MATKPEDVLKHFEQLNESQESHEQEKEHSLRENALNRAQNPLHLQAGTAFDWEDMDLWAQELERLDREGPGLSDKGKNTQE
ncbi:hypothetical protein [Cellvibrio japonicus]|uniref:Uncharacterized protein n=1 Tax=Cellvibrio japonicus (strain Ueda107) TaxID=498211 RepID=B3PCR3_CELJU|nr:hypothetical protein [Cellvibrio japonicus]ACE82685.1 hypothetical protein CJA_2973 [Cellvibrio japonicus Ueda107]QEI13283.1 hypothetical protein FY117_14335 [Cellvibrio japonicus]QEI16857.1 hypothetical protein FY116_14340 [Cellvibrio japonicus]QEI20435.1 hypothetical protein FY115_14335 [Cellvibrio japonicus]